VAGQAATLWVRARPLIQAHRAAGITIEDTPPE